MSYTVQFADRPERVAVEIGQTILEAALAAGIPYPHGCRSGNCGACKSELIDGDVELSPCSDYALSAAEREQGLILACRAVPWSDAAVRWLDPNETAAHPIRHMSCTVAGLGQATHDIRVVRLAIESGGPFDFSAGQYAQVTFADLPPRDFSMASQPDEAEIEFHIRTTPGGAVSPYVAGQLSLGETVRVEGPYGAAHLREGHRGPIVALAGGSGLAPIKAIVEAALGRGMSQPITLYFGARAERDLYLEDHFAALTEKHPNLRFVPVLSEPDGETERRTGFLADALAADFIDLDGAKAYLAGPPIMVETCTDALRKLGVRRQDVHADAFYTEAEKAKLEAGA
ncbi:MAG: 2Fe-2S iron-sulfur cluster-binding protein [Alphaproteobacteria bacterium]|nr:2Fe-2S iron-sulfur cluster-binding protein [Alphaproteobacteria bacterium]